MLVKNGSGTEVKKSRRTGLDKNERNRSGVPDPKKFERTGKDTFVVHADGGNYFEGKVTNPNVRIKDSGKLFFDKVGICLKQCENKNKRCSTCIRFNELKEPANAC